MVTKCRSVLSILQDGCRYSVNTTLTTHLGSRVTELLIDTGAIITVLPINRVAGIINTTNLKNTCYISGAVSSVSYAIYPVVFDKLCIGEITLLNVQVWVTDNPYVYTAVLGMDILSSLDFMQYGCSGKLLLGGPKEDFHVKPSIVDNVLLDCLEAMGKKDLYDKIHSVLPTTIDMNYKEFRSLVLKAIENI